MPRKNFEITLKTKPIKIISVFKHILDNGGTINLNIGNGNFIYAIGGDNAILCKLQNGVHYSANGDKWIKI